MRNRDRIALFALTAAGMLWGLGVPLSKLVLPWLGPGWLTVARFAVATPMLVVAGRRGLRAAATPGVILSGALGFGAVILLQNVGIARTSVSHAALVIGSIPVLVALMSAARGQGATGPVAWLGHGLALTGIGLVASAGGDGATLAGDLLVFASAVISAGCIAAGPRLLAGRDAASVTAVQFAGGGLVALPAALATSGVPSAPAHAGSVVALVVLALLTPVPFWLFAFGQARVPSAVAGAFVNLEPVVGVAAGWLAFGEVATVAQLAGGAAVLAGIGLSTGSSGPPPTQPRESADGAPTQTEPTAVARAAGTGVLRRAGRAGGHASVRPASGRPRARPLAGRARLDRPRSGLRASRGHGHEARRHADHRAGRHSPSSDDEVRGRASLRAWTRAERVRWARRPRRRQLM